MTDTQQATTTNSESTAPAMNEVTYFFRPIKTTKTGDKGFEVSKAAFDGAGIKYEEIRADSKDPNVPGELEAIKREPFKTTLPVITVAQLMELKPTLVQNIIDDLVKGAVGAEFVDKLKAPDLEVITPAWIVDKLSTSRSAAIPPEQFKEFAKLVDQVLSAAGTKRGTIDILVDLVSKRFSKQVLNSYNRFEEKFGALLEKAITCLEGSSDEVIAHYVPVCEALTDNLDNWRTAQDAVAEQELDL